MTGAIVVPNYAPEPILVRCSDNRERAPDCRGLGDVRPRAVGPGGAREQRSR